jgi:hypothetical protein
MHSTVRVDGVVKAYATSRKVTGSTPNGLKILVIYLIPPAAQGP